MLAVLLVSTNILIFALYRKTAALIKSETGKLTQSVNETMNAGAKLVEIRDYYEHANDEFQRMLKEAQRDADRPKQDRYRRLLDRLNALKARTLDRTASLLDSDGKDSPRVRRRSSSRRSRRSRRPRSRSSKSSGGSPNANGGRSSSAGSQT